MKRIYVTIGSRVEQEGDAPEDKGEFLAIDWDTKQIVGTYIADSGEEVTVGRSRGASGLTWHDGKIYLCCRNGIMSLDPDTYEEAGRITDAPYGGYHGMASDGTTLWVTAHPVGALVGIRNDEVVEDLPTADEDEHVGACGLNAVGFSPAGEMFAMYSHKKQIFNYTRQEVAVEGLLNAPHDLTFINEDEVLYTESSHRDLCVANVRTGEIQRIYSRNQLYTGDNSPEWAKGGWMRGVAYDSVEDRAFVMCGPGTIYEVKPSGWGIRTVDSFTFCERKGANPFNLILDPRDWT